MAHGSQPLLHLSERERLIVALVRQVDGITRANLIQRSGLSGTAVYRATEDLVAKNFLWVGETLADGRGQPSHRIHLNPDAVFTLGLSVMTDFAEAAIVDLAGEVRMLADVSAPGMLRRDIIANTRAALDAAMNDWLPRKAIRGAGVAIAGFFVTDGSETNTPASLDDWALRDLRPEFETAFDCPVVVENIGNAAVVGEMMLGVGQRFRSFAYVNFAAGFGGGLVIDGRPWRGVHGNAGEFADLVKAANLTVPNLDRLNATLAATGIDFASVSDLLANYCDQWPAVENWIAAAVPALKFLGRAVSATVDVEALVLGGRLPAPLAVRLAAAVQSASSVPDVAERRSRPRRRLEIVPAQLSSRASVIGAATLAMPEVLSMRSPH